MKSKNLIKRRPSTQRIIRQALQSRSFSLAEVTLLAGATLQLADNCEIILPGLDLF